MFDVSIISISLFFTSFYSYKDLIGEVKITKPKINNHPRGNVNGIKIEEYDGCKRDSGNFIDIIIKHDRPELHGRLPNKESIERIVEVIYKS